MKKFLIILILLLIIIPVSIHFWGGSLIKKGIQKYIPPIVGVPVSVGNISISFFEGEFMPYNKYHKFVVNGKKSNVIYQMSSKDSSSSWYNGLFSS